MLAKTAGHATLESCIQEEAVEEVTKLLKRNQALDEELWSMLTEVETTLHHGHIMTAALSKHELRAKAVARTLNTEMYAAAASEMS